MKKHLIATAIAAAVAAPAMAQNVTLFGALDAGVFRTSNVNAAGADGVMYTDGAMTSSIWGFRGSEDLGGGMRATMELISDAQTNNGADSQNGLFRRAANVGLAGKFGEVNLGVKTNPLIAMRGNLLPLSGNSVGSNVDAALGYADFFTRNAITWTSPNLSGLVVQAQYGLSNTAGDSTAGSVFAGNFSYTVGGGFTLRGAFQERKPGAALALAQANASASGKSTNMLGLGYVDGNLRLGIAVTNQEINNAAFTTSSGPVLAVGRDYRITSVGAAYRVSPAWDLGANYVSGEGSALSNLQARYSLSKRTTAYAMFNRVDNGSVITIPLFGTNTGTTNGSLYTVGANASTALLGAASTATTGVGAGLIHSF